MEENEKEQPMFQIHFSKRYLSISIALVIVVIFSIIFAIFIISQGNSQKENYDSQLSELKEELKDIKKRNTNLKSDLQKIKGENLEKFDLLDDFCGSQKCLFSDKNGSVGITTVKGYYLPVNIGGQSQNSHICHSFNLNENNQNTFNVEESSPSSQPYFYFDLDSLEPNIRTKIQNSSENNYIQLRILKTHTSTIEPGANKCISHVEILSIE